MNESVSMSLERPGDPCAFVVLGGMGDLTKRKLLPALYNLRCNNLLPSNFAIVGVARRALDEAGYRAELTAAMQQFATRPVENTTWEDFVSHIYYVRGDLDDPDTFVRLRSQLEAVSGKHATHGNTLFYLAIPPDEFGPAVTRLGEAGLAKSTNGEWRRIIIEKPFGREIESSRQLNERLTAVFSEEQIYRIDHYLGKETVQNILVFRFANGIFEPIWNRRYIDQVQITVAEDLGVEGRGAFYETAGVLRDIIQNHIFQLLSLVAMEPPSNLAAEAVRNEKVKVLDAIRPMQPAEIIQNAVRGQYGDGFINGAKVPAYRAEPKVSPKSQVETYAALKLQIDNWRWAGVPFYLRSGKRMAKRNSVISIVFRRPPLTLFREAGVQSIDPNRLDIRIQPEEAIGIQMKAKVPGAGIVLRNVKLDFSYKLFGEQAPATGYERLLYDCMVGDPTLFHRADIVDAAWRIATPILDLWGSLPARDFPNYGAGTWGPLDADELLRRDGRNWVNLD